MDFDSNYAGRLPDETETHLFRIAQEALTNVARHSEAKHVRVRLESHRGEIALTHSGRWPRAAASAAGPPRRPMKQAPGHSG